MPFLQIVKYIKIELSELFYTCSRHFKGKDSIINSGWHQKVINLNSGTLRGLNALYPDFTLSQLDCCKAETRFIRRWGKDDLILFPNIKNRHYGKAEFNYSEFVDNDRKHNSWLKSNWFIFNRPTYKSLFYQSKI